jgi:hypothetical protein
MAQTRRVTQAGLADEVRTALVEEAKQHQSRGELEAEAARRGIDAASAAGMSTDELRHALARERPRDAAAGEAQQHPGRRGEQNEIEYYNRSEGGPQRDSGGQETPGPVSDPPS